LSRGKTEEKLAFVKIVRLAGYSCCFQVAVVVRRECSMIGGSSLNARLPLTLKFTGDDRDLYGGLFRLHVLHHAGEKPLYGH
jgi:hypothetical protein